MMRGARVLIVEDEPLSREMLERMLSTRGFEVQTAVDGPSCLEWLECNEADLVLLDVSMPGLSGLDVLKVIRRDHAADQLPVILVSALVDSEDVIAGLEAGANDYVVKPVNLPILLARIGVSLRIRRSVERLLEAERHRVMLESLEEACDRLEAPMTEIVDQLRQLVDAPSADPAETERRLRRTLEWALQAGELIRRFRKVAGYRTVPYTDGMGSFVAASLAGAPVNGDEGGGSSAK
ncbi:MAG: response regulator transcription factor [Planctomycetota bacterium]|jgi:DNA-binding response OmpR family regulator